MTTGCGDCIGYVICNPSSVLATDIQTMKLATCNKDYCKNDKAQECVDDQSVESRNPESFDQDNVIQDQEFIKANYSQQ